MKRLTLATALLLATVSSSSWAQSPADYDVHHPDQKEAPAATPPTSPAAQSGMGQGMMGGSGMMDIMGGRMPMTNMMQMMGMMQQSGAGMGGMATIDHVEGWIAFLRTELKITDAQASAWNAFADALRTNAKNLGEVRASMMPQADAASPTLVDRLALQEKWLTARLEGTRAFKSAVTNLASTLSDDQKKTADELLAPHMGMMAMMSAMQSGQMGPGQMMPGKMMPGR
jgi:LTXXQ motif family protein